MHCCASGEPNGGGIERYATSLVYLLDEKQLTKDCQGRRRVIEVATRPGRTSAVRVKTFSQRRSEFPPRRLGRRAGFNEGTRELQADEVIARAMHHAQHLGTQGPGDRGQGSQGS